MNLVTQMLPRIASTYKSAAFDLDEKIRPIFLKYGLYLDTAQLEEAIAAVYITAEKLGNGLLEDDVKIIVVEKEKSIIPIGGIAMASLLTLPTLSVGSDLM